ncbi:MAG: sulfatase-like hydrolase/transferase [Planctomycetes bacterium]|nr:sulfatase-like hydrolase/transferase [Planctomycetota bacterium]
MPHSQPNILLLMSDQHHKRALGCADRQRSHTPNLDALAARGARFENTSCPFPLCGPSRMAFMTARWPHRTDCLTNLSELSSDIPTFAHAFHAAGYETVLSGRMHFVGFDQRHGFERRLIGDVPPSAFIKKGWGLEPVLGNLVDTPGMSRAGIAKSGPGRTGYHAYDEAVTDATVRWLQERKARKSSAETKPFMLVAGLASPHCPFVAPPEDFYRYWDALTDADLPDPRLDTLHPVHQEMRKRSGIDPLPDAVIRRRVHCAYLGLVTFLDRCVGRMLDALRESGLQENTVVVYTSDHGEQLGEHGMWWKSTFYEGSVGVPLLMAGPGVRLSGLVRCENVNLIDLGPTLLDLAGAEGLPGADGRSFARLLKGDSSNWVNETFAEHVSWNGMQPQRMVRRGPWKYCYYHGNAPELFNLDEDPHEFHNRATDPACAQVCADLKARVLEEWDPERMATRLALLQKEETLLTKWHRSRHLPEPDPAWFDAPQDNHIEPIRPPGRG